MPDRRTNQSALQAPRRRPTPALAVALAALVVAVGGSALAALAAIPENGRFTACYQTSASVLDRIVVLAEPGEACPSTYARVTWSETGQPGPAGPSGPAGPAGPPGPAGASRGSTLLVNVVERRLRITSDRDVVARCAKGSRAVGGGAVVHSGARHQPRNSFPWVEKRVPVGWAFRPYEQRSFAILPSVVKQTTYWRGLPPHAHNYYTTPSAVPRGPLGFARAPAEVTVYAVCLRTLQVATTR